MNRYKNLFKNTSLFFIANMGSKIISFLMVRFYTELLDTAEYGTLDALTTLVFFIAPLCSLSIQEAVFRYCMDKDRDKAGVLKSAYRILGWGSLVVVLCGGLVFCFLNNSLVVLVVLLVVSEIYYNVSLQYSRGVGEVRVYALSGVLYTIVMVTANIVYMAGFQWGIYGYLLAMITANGLVTLFLVLRLRLGKILCQGVYDKNLTVSMIKYSLPLVPNAIFWWMMSVADRYVLIYEHGVGMNGIYAVANKIPTVLNVFGSIFFQAWQMSAVESYEDENRKEFYSNIFSIFFGSMILIVGALNVVVKPIYMFFVAEEYFIAWKYTSFLMLAMLFSSASCFVGTYYNVVMKTNRNLRTTIIGFMSNLVLDLILIPPFGIQGAAIATFAGYFVTWIIRVYDTNKFMNIRYHYLRITVSLLLCICQGILLAVDYKYADWINIVLLLVLMYNERKVIRAVIQKGMGVLKWERK